MIGRIWTRFAFLSDFSYNLYSFLIVEKIIKLLLLTLNMTLEGLMSHGNTFNESSAIDHLSCLRLLNALI